MSVECCYKGSVAHPGVGRHTEACLYSTFPYTQPYIEKERTQFIVHSSSYTVHRTQFIVHTIRLQSVSKPKAQVQVPLAA